MVTRNMALSEMNLRGIHINTATASYSLVPSDSGIMFINTYTTLTTYTLPVVADGKGKMFWFMNAANDNFATMITAQSAVIKGSGSTVTSHRTTGRGDWAVVIGDGTNYYLFGVGFGTTA